MVQEKKNNKESFHFTENRTLSSLVFLKKERRKNKNVNFILSYSVIICYNRNSGRNHYIMRITSFFMKENISYIWSLELKDVVEELKNKFK